MQISPLEYFSENRIKYQDLSDNTKAKIRRTSQLRILVFTVTVLAVYFSTTISMWLLLASLFVGIASFILLVRKHLSLYKKKQWFDALVKVNSDEIDILKMDRNPEYTGQEFIDDDHPYSSDLDIFGGKSIFSLINRSSTINGKIQLANQLTEPNTDEEHIIERQEAIAELSNKSDWRQQFQATGFLNDEQKGEVEGLLKWSEQKSSNFNTLFYKSMLIINPLIGFSVVLLISLGLLSASAFVLFLIIPFAIVGFKIGNINKEHGLMSRKTTLLIKYSSLFKLIENENFSSKVISQIKSELLVDEHSAYAEIKHLYSIMSSFDYRLNMIMGILLNVFFLWDIKQLVRLEKWKLKNNTRIHSWFSKLSTIDELNSFAGFNYSFELNTFPVFSDSFKLEAKNAKHPFIGGSVNVGNPINIGGLKNFKVITGANMAGKSTYLRTVGVNLVLAMTGSAVMADEFTFKPINIITGIKTSDSLQDGESYFFAELKRLKAIIDRLEDGDRLFVILDEILRGTNSADKQKGSLGLIKQLLRLNATGIIATHDLALGKLIDSFPENIVNKRFEVEIANNELVFDYKIKDGVSQNLNASFLMKKMGITLED